MNEERDFILKSDWLHFQIHQSSGWGISLSILLISTHIQ